MDRFRQKSNKKNNQSIQNQNSKLPLFATDVKTCENLKIKEILRNVKINRSMRLKAPRGSKVIPNNDLSDGNECDVQSDMKTYSSDPEINTLCSSFEEEDAKDEVNNQKIDSAYTAEVSETLSDMKSESNKQREIDNEVEESIGSIDKPIEDCSDSESTIEINTDPVKNTVMDSPRDTLPCLPAITVSENAQRVRKLSLDQTMLARRGSLSQSEAHLNSVGKMPLERKSSFFKKKMEKFFENTSKIFKRQSLSKADIIQSPGSISCSLQSLNDACNYNNKYLSPGRSQELPTDSLSSLNSSTVGISESSCPDSQPESPNSELSRLCGSQPFLSVSKSVHSLNEAYIQEQMLNSRAISMSSGLDSATKDTKKRSSKANRVTWLASEGLTNYMRRVIQHEKSKDEPKPDSSKTDTRTRKLSYHRAVSGEDPSRYDSSLRRRKPIIPEHSEANYELANMLTDFTANGVPPMRQWIIYEISEEALRTFYWACEGIDIEIPPLHSNELARQTAIKELIITEVNYIKYLVAIVQIFMAAAHALQEYGWLRNVETERLFSNMPDVLNSSLIFWETTICPMLSDARKRQTIFNIELMYNGFVSIRDYFVPYTKYVTEQSKILEYLRSLSNNEEFMFYLEWCNSHHASKRLQLSDLLSKPMQRITKYSLLINRILNHTDIEPERTMLLAMESLCKNLVTDLNRSIRRREELEIIDKLSADIDCYELDFKDEDMDRVFRMYSSLNLRAPMVGCLSTYSRALVHQGDVRFKDSIKEVDARAFLMTDMLLICKKISKGSSHSYKLIRPKYMINSMLFMGQYNKNKSTCKELVSLLFLLLDDVGSSQQCFTFTDPQGRDNNTFVKLWHSKLREARLSYDLGVWIARHPSREITDQELDTSSVAERTRRMASEEYVEREAKERVATMQHYMWGSTECDFSNSMQTDSFEVGDPVASTSKDTYLQPIPPIQPPGPPPPPPEAAAQNLLAPSHMLPPTGQTPLTVQTLPPTLQTQLPPTYQPFSSSVQTLLPTMQTLLPPAVQTSMPPTGPTYPPMVQTQPTTMQTPLLPTEQSYPPMVQTQPTTMQTPLLPTEQSYPPMVQTQPTMVQTLLPPTGQTYPPMVKTLLPTVQTPLPSTEQTFPSTVQTLPPTVQTPLPSTEQTYPPTVQTLPPTVQTLSPTVQTLPLTVPTPLSPTVQAPLQKLLSQSLPVPAPQGPPPITQRHLLHRASTGGSSRMSSFHKTSSITSRDEPPPPVLQQEFFLHRPGSSWETIPRPADYRKITVNKFGESVSTTHNYQSKTPFPRPNTFSSNTLKVQHHSVVLALVNSLPDLTIQSTSSNSPTPALLKTPSKTIYHSHQELLTKNRLSAPSTHSTHHLSPHDRGSSYPPPSPTRRSLRRGIAFSFSVKESTPPLSKMDHVDCSGISLDQASRSSTLTKMKHKVQSQNTEVQVEAIPDEGLDREPMKSSRAQEQPQNSEVQVEAMPDTAAAPSGSVKESTKTSRAKEVSSLTSSLTSVNGQKDESSLLDYPQNSHSSQECLAPTTGAPAGPIR